ncbi:FUSC family protein [Jongsikchunia kroppenstedtii]|uniref:FUSC family protein n=1 Tax=Jongsikchunia kroppenstedtii TaxID=1121721 RepID=UPI0003667F92|nr:FUSC family protein [Jongsikchunia kroppenstedtii]
MSTARVYATSAWRDAKDNLWAADPGLIRLRQGLRAATAVGTTILVQWIASKIVGVDGKAAVLHILLGAIVALTATNGIKELHRSSTVKTCAGVPFSAGFGVSLSYVVTHHPAATVPMFMVVVFIAVWVRRFGARWQTWGTTFFFGFFLNVFIKLPAHTAPSVFVALVVSAAWIAILLTTALHVDQRKLFVRTVSALRARMRSTVAAALAVIDTNGSRRTVAQLRQELAKATDAALLLDGLLADERSLPRGASPGVLRRWIVDLELGIDEVSSATLDLVRRAAAGDADARAALPAVRSTLETLGWADADAARTDARNLLDRHRQLQPVRRLVSGDRLLIDAVDDWTSGRIRMQEASAQGPGADFVPKVTLAGWSLPGSAGPAAVAIKTAHGNRRWIPLRLTTRHAVQLAVTAGVAVELGRLVSPDRYYWAVVTAFLMFTGAATASETARKAIGSMAGTFVGIWIAMSLEQLTAGNLAVSVSIMVACIFFAQYYAQVSSLVSRLFMTVALGQMFGLIEPALEHNLLLTRLGETVIGGLTGIVASAVILRVSTIDTQRAARHALLIRLAELLDRCADPTSHPRTDGDTLAAAIAVDEAARQLSAVAGSHIRPIMLDSEAAGRTQRVTILRLCAAGGRAVAQAVYRTEPPLPPGVSAACTELSAECRRLAGLARLGKATTPPDGPVPQRISDILGAERDDQHVVLYVRIQRLADSLGLLSPVHST